MTSKLFLFVILIVAIAYTQPALNRRTISGVQLKTLPESNWQFSSQAIFPTFLKIRDPKTNKMIDLPESFVRTEVLLQNDFIYALTNRFNVLVSVPLRWRNYFSPDLIQKNKGIGDLWLGGYFQLTRNINSQFFVITPTGQNKNLKPTELPLGEGAFQLGGALNTTFSVFSIPLVLSASYLYRAKDNNKIDLGDQLGLLVSSANYLKTDYGNFLYETGLIIKHRFSDKLNGKSLANSDFNSATLFAGFNFYYNPNLRFGLSVPFSVYHREAWLTDYAIVLNFDLLLRNLK